MASSLRSNRNSISALMGSLIWARPDFGLCLNPSTGCKLIRPIFKVQARPPAGWAPVLIGPARSMSPLDTFEAIEFACRAPNTITNLWTATNINIYLLYSLKIIMP
eukprot:TRINITY_DN12040_c0_g1_i1.p1 TRINITY_DN12040_c0_g1~~TRINITY_DN12040_c0_g1_i1.p1  ORF type:complete len:106 (-),score=2.00 TRINITY_DN12040_c0_g1_i1:748-1065(-)